VFFQVVAFTLVSSVIGIPFSYYLMKRNVWIAMMFGLGFFVLGLVGSFFIPETLERSKASYESVDSASYYGVDHADDNDAAPLHRDWMRAQMSKLFEKATESFFIFKSPMLFGLSITFLLQTLSGNVSEVGLSSLHFPHTIILKMFF
jgi:hypothetical protein